MRHTCHLVTLLKKVEAPPKHVKVRQTDKQTKKTLVLTKEIQIYEKEVIMNTVELRKNKLDASHCEKSGTSLSSALNFSLATRKQVNLDLAQFKLFHYTTVQQACLSSLD